MSSLWQYVRGMASPSRYELVDNDKDRSDSHDRPAWSSPSLSSLSSLSSSTSHSSSSSHTAVWPDSPSQAPRHRNVLALLVRRLRRGTTTLLLIDLFIVVVLLVAFEPLITLLRRNEEFFGPRVVLSGPTSVNAWDPTGMTTKHALSIPLPPPPPPPPAAQRNAIPRILHQTTATEAIPEKWRESQQSCKEAYKGFEYKLWTDASARAFLADEYPWFVDVWDNYAFPIQRADAIRYFVLYHFGGIYLDMDTWCNASFPLERIEATPEDNSDGAQHRALFKSTLPTGITNDFMIASARHPAYAAAIAQLPLYNAITHFWARWQPYAVIMISAGPMFLTMVVKGYLQTPPYALHARTIGVINATELAPFITDLESGTWHQGDAKALMWIGTRPWTWFGMGAIGLVAGLFVVNRLLTWCYGCARGSRSSLSSSSSEGGLLKMSKIV